MAVAVSVLLAACGGAVEETPPEGDIDAAAAISVEPGAPALADGATPAGEPDAPIDPADPIEPDAPPPDLPEPPAEAAAETPAEDLAPPAPPEAAAPEPPVAEAATPMEPSPLVADVVLGDDMRDLILAGDPVAGRTYVTRCTACHALDPGGDAHAAAQVGPPLYGIFGARIGGAVGFEYSPAFDALHEANIVWSAARLNLFLADPDGVVPGTAMTVRGITNDETRANVIAFLRSLAVSPLPLDGGEGAVLAGDPELLARIATADIGRGQDLAARCSGCHRFAEGEEPLTGPNLYDIVGKPIAGAEGYAYSAALRALRENGAIWSYDRLDAFLASPQEAIPGTRMGFGGVEEPRDRAAIIAYLRQLAPEPFPLATDTDTQIGTVREGLRPVTFTAEQAEAGGLAYAQWCQRCHGENLHGEVDLRLGEGLGVVPAIIGPNFEHAWFTGDVGALMARIVTTMPPDNEGTLSPETYAEILAYILQRNGFVLGTAPLPENIEALRQMGFYQE